jgi:hypothetical protein
MKRGMVLCPLLTGWTTEAVVAGTLQVELLHGFEKLDCLGRYTPPKISPDWYSSSYHRRNSMSQADALAA